MNNTTMTIGLSARHADVLARPESRAFLANPGFPVPDATAIRRVGSTGVEEFLATGLLLREALEQSGGLAPDHAVLDIGCGWGRLAMPLAARLGPAGRYLGMDAAAEAIAWCRRHVAEVDSRFRFHHADIRNSYANPQGRIAAAAATLVPWEERFDRVVAFSLFTHLLPDAMVRYLAEAARLCRPGGVLVATFFVLDAEARSALAAGQADRAFPAKHGIARLSNPAIPEDAVAYDAAEMLALFDAAGFDAEWRPGAWCPRSAPPFEYQDLVVARRRGTPTGGAGLRGAVSSLRGGAVRGWAWDAGSDAPVPLRLEIAGRTVAEAVPDSLAEGAPPAGPPPGVAAGFTLAVPPHLLGREVRDLRVWAGPLPLLHRPLARLADPAEELAAAWRRESVRRGLWRVEALRWQADGSLDGEVWAIAPRGVAPARPPWLFLGEARVQIEPLEAIEDEAGAALGLAPGVFRPHYGFHLPAALLGRGGRLRLGTAPQELWEPVGGFPLAPAAVDDDWTSAMDRRAASEALRAVTGRSLTAHGRLLDLPPTAVLPPPGDAGVILALDGLDPPTQGGDAALVAALVAALAPGGLALLGMPGSAALLDGAGGTARLLQWLRHGMVPAMEAPAGRRVLRSQTHLAEVWGAAFEVVALREASLSGLRDLVVLRQRGAATIKGQRG